jgi:hypothetical protein
MNALVPQLLLLLKQSRFVGLLQDLELAVDHGIDALDVGQQAGDHADTS